MRADLQVTDDPAGVAAEMMAGVTGHMVVTGGSTPKAAYGQLAAMRDDWSDVQLWFTDERCVRPEHEHSNYLMVKESLLDHAEGAAVHRMPGELGPREGADEYERTIDDAFGAELPVFDFMLLGLGPDAHTCSLFPGDDALGERERRVVGVERPGMAPLVARITLTLPVVNAARRAVFLGHGRRQGGGGGPGLRGTPRPPRAGSLVDGALTLLCDPAAASELPG